MDGSTTTAMEYDEAGNQKEIVGPNIGTITSAYTALNEPRTRTDNKSQLFTYAFDVLGRMTSIVSPDGTSSWVWDTAANGVGKLKSRGNTGFTETYAYDSSSRISSATTSITPIGGSGSTDYTTEHTYDTYGRPLNTTFAGGFVLTRAYNVRGYLSQLKNGATTIQTINDMDAFGNSIDESYANGVETLRTFDPETGRLTDINTSKGTTKFQDNDYAWRSNGTLESRVANPAYGLAATRKETYDYDVLNRVKLAETYINGSSIRDLVYEYDELGNIESKTSTVTGDTDVTGYAYGAGTAGPHAVTGANIDGVSNILTYDSNGAVTRYDIAGTSNDKYLAYNAYNVPTTIVVGDSIDDSSPVAKDEFAYGPNGQRYTRRTTWQDGSTTKFEVVYYIGPVEIIYDNSVTNIQKVTKTKLSANIMHVEMIGTVTDSFFEYAHRDHLGSIEVVTDENGYKLDDLAFDPFGSRKQPDWLGKVTSSELDDLLELDWGHTSKVRGFTGHEHLDRTGFVHMNGRIFDPTLGRFLSPDPIVQFPTHSQNWNRYSYLNNIPTSAIDPTGFEMDEIVVKGRRLDWTGGTGSIGGPMMVGTGMGRGAPSEAGDRRNNDYVEEITVTEARHEGTDSAYIAMGFSGGYNFVGVFDSYGNAGVWGFRPVSSLFEPATQIGGTFLAGANLGLTYAGYSDGKLPGVWRSSTNGNWYFDRFNGNAYIKGRSNVNFQTRHLAYLGRGIVFLDGAMEIAELRTAVDSGDRIGTADAVVDLGVVIYGASGGPIPAWGALWYGLSDSFIAPWASGPASYLYEIPIAGGGVQPMVYHGRDVTITIRNSR